MIRATSIVRRAAVKLGRVAGTVTLGHGARHTRRVALEAEGGLSLLVDLERATVLDDGDALKLDDGRLVVVRAAPEALLEIRAENPLRLLRAAWHIGNRHTPAEFTADAIYIAADHVLAELARAQGCGVMPVTRPFMPERGAYDQGGQEHVRHEHGRYGHDHAPHAHGSDENCPGGNHAHHHTEGPEH